MVLGAADIPGRWQMDGGTAVVAGVAVAAVDFQVGGRKAEICYYAYFRGSAALLRAPAEQAAQWSEKSNTSGNWERMWIEYNTSFFFPTNMAQLRKHKLEMITWTGSSALQRRPGPLPHPCHVAGEPTR